MKPRTLPGKMYTTNLNYGLDLLIKIFLLSLIQKQISFIANHNVFVGSVVEWLKHRTDDQHGLGSKTHLRHSVVSLGKTLYGTFPCLVILTSSSKLQSYLYQITSGQQYLGISGSRSGYLLTLCIAPPSLSCESGG